MKLQLFEAMQRSSMKFGLVVAAHSGRISLSLCLGSSFSFWRSRCLTLYPCKCTGMVRVVMHAGVLGNVLMAFLHNRAAESHEVWWDCSS